jgi:acid phosphatase family membrane protein YuiD
MHDNVVEVFRNVYFWSAILSWLAAQFTKMLCGLYQTRRLDFRYLASTGGMPSAHSAASCGLAACIGIHQGFGSPIFSLALTFAIIVMFDASTVRRAAGLQARLLNEIVDELFKEHHLSERKLAELLGHTRLEVVMGMIMGILMAMLVTAGGIWMQPAA